jgi:translation initiation factor RLI1
MKNQFDKTPFDDSLKQLNYDVTWKEKRHQKYKNKLSIDIDKLESRTTLKNVAVYCTSIAVFLLVFFVGYNNFFKVDSPIIDSHFVSDIPSSQKGSAIFDDKDDEVKEEVSGDSNGYFERLPITDEIISTLSIPLNAHEKIKSLAGEPIVSAETRPVGITISVEYREDDVFLHESSNPYNDVEQMTNEAKDWYITKDGVEELEIGGYPAIFNDSGYWNTLHVITKEKFFTITANDERELLIDIANLIKFDE